jgi:hypothetical protein
MGAPAPRLDSAGNVCHSFFMRAVLAISLLFGTGVSFFGDRAFTAIPGPALAYHQ